MTANQMKYLLTLVKQKDRKLITGVAQIYGVNKSTVSRALSVCMDKGLLDHQYELTKYGKMYVDHYMNQYEQVYTWLYKHGISAEKAREDTFAMLESCSAETLQMIGQSGEFCKACAHFQEKGHRVSLAGSDLSEYVQQGEYQVPFVFHKENKRGPEQISMANDAFFHPGKMIIKKNNSKLCLKLKRVKQQSLREKIKLEGKLRTMAYEFDGIVKEIFIDDDTAHIPLSALKFICIKDDHILQGYVRLKMTCTVGVIHMPESSAMLTVYL